MPKDSVSSIIRAMNILECFMDTDTEWTLKKLVHHLDLPTTTVHRQLSTLMESGYLTQDPVRKSYHVGPRLLLLASRIVSSSDLRSIARPELEVLSAKVKETINLSVLLGQDIFYLDKVETFRSVVCNTKIGTCAPAHATSCGKVMLAYKDEAFVDDICQKLTPSAALTERTITSPEQLRSELVQVRLKGYAIDDGEIEPDLVCVAAPIIDINQSVIAAVSIAGPSFRMKKELDSMIHEVQLAASNISCLMGGRGSFLKKT